MGFSDFIRKVLVGFAWGEVYPGKPAPPPTAVDGRTAALRVLRRYLSELTFYRENKSGAAMIGFSIPLKDIHIEWPDSVDIERELPVMALISGGPIDYQFVGMGNWVDESTRDVHGKNTVLQVQNENVETIFIEVLCASKQERRALREGIVNALSPTELMAGIRFKVPDYYNQTATFSVQKGTIVEDGDSVKNRRALRIEVEMSYLGVVLVNTLPLTPVTTLFVDTEDGATVIDLDPEDPDRVALEGAAGEPTEIDRDYP